MTIEPPQRDLWNQPTEVFEPIRDGYDPEPAGKPSKMTRHVLIGAAVVLVGALFAGGALYLSESAAKTGTTAAAPTPARITPGVATTTQPAATTTTAATGTPAATTTTTTTTTTATTTVLPAPGASCSQMGQSVMSNGGLILTCEVSGESVARWVARSIPAVGYPCNQTESGTLGYTADGTQLLCTHANGADTYTWTNPGPVAGGTHQPGQKCNTKKETVGKTADGKALLCQPDHGNSSAGTWHAAS